MLKLSDQAVEHVAFDAIATHDSEYSANQHVEAAILEFGVLSHCCQPESADRLDDDRVLSPESGFLSPVAPSQLPLFTQVTLDLDSGTSLILGNVTL